MVTLFVQKNIQKNERKIRSESKRYRWKWFRSMTRRNVRHFPPDSGRMTPNSVCLWHHREHGDSNKRWRKRRFEPSQETGVKKMIHGNVSSEFISLWFASVYGTAGSIQSCVSPLVLRLQKYESGNSVRRTYLQRHIRSSINPERKWQFYFWNNRKITKNGNFKCHFLENSWSYRREILHDNIENQVQWHILELSSFF